MFTAELTRTCQVSRCAVYIWHPTMVQSGNSDQCWMGRGGWCQAQRHQQLPKSPVQNPAYLCLNIPINEKLHMICEVLLELWGAPIFPSRSSVTSARKAMLHPPLQVVQTSRNTTFRKLQRVRAPLITKGEGNIKFSGACFETHPQIVPSISSECFGREKKNCSDFQI